MATRKLSTILTEVFETIQESVSSHQRYERQLQTLYQNSNFDSFYSEFIRHLKYFLIESNVNNPFVDKGLTFCAKFACSLQSLNQLDKNKKECNDDNSAAAHYDNDAMCPFLTKLIPDILKCHRSALARYRVCQFVNLLLKQMALKEYMLDENMCTEISDVMLEGFTDIKPTIRAQSIESLHCLQDPSDPNDPVIKAFIHSLNDSCKSVRKMSVHLIAMNLHTILHVLKRCRDVEMSVRYVAYNKFVTLPINALKIHQRQYLLRNGFTDSNEKIRTLVETSLIPKWFEQCDKNCLKLLHMLILDSNENDFKQSLELIETLLAVLFRDFPLGEHMDVLKLNSNKLIEQDASWQLLVFWRFFINYLRRMESGSDYIDQIMPDLIHFCAFIEQIRTGHENVKSDWDLLVYHQMLTETLKMLEDYDFTDEVGRSVALPLIEKILLKDSLSYDNIELLVRIFGFMELDLEKRANKLCNIISEIRVPLVQQPLSDTLRIKREDQMAQTRLKLNIARNDQDDAVDRQDQEKCHQLEHVIQQYEAELKRIGDEYVELSKVRVTRNEPMVIVKCLDILIAIMSLKDVSKMTPSIEIAREKFVKPLLTCNDPRICKRVLTFYGLCSFVDRTIAKETMNLFINPILVHKYDSPVEEQIIITAIKCTTDMIMLYGTDYFKSSPEGDSELNSDAQQTKRQLYTNSYVAENKTHISANISMEQTIDLFTELMDDDSELLREQVCESLAILMCSGLIQNAFLLSRLVLKWFNPMTEKEPRVRQLIGFMFRELTDLEGSLNMMEGMFIPTLNTVAEAPAKSPLAEINIDGAIKFLLALINPASFRYHYNLDTYKNVSLSLCGEICDKPRSKATGIYLKALCQIDVPTDIETVQDLKRQTDIMLQMIREKNLLRYVTKYRNKLDSRTEKTSIANANEDERTEDENVEMESIQQTEQTSGNTTRTSTTRYPVLSLKRRKRSSRSKICEELMDVEEENTSETNPEQQSVAYETDSDHVTQSNNQKRKLRKRN